MASSRPQKKVEYGAHLPPFKLPPLVIEKGNSLYSRADLETLAQGKISKIFGDPFKKQDKYELQVRIPSSPLLLIDRVTAIEGEPDSLSEGVIWTETDVVANAWYLHEGHMPAGFVLEAAQGILLLASWLGADSVNKGLRAYRSLGAKIEFLGKLPKVGDTLCFEIHIERFICQGEMCLLFYYFDCLIDGEARLRVRDGQGGFFSRDELSHPAGVKWQADQMQLQENAQLAAPFKLTQHRQFSREQIEAFANGDAFACFGPGYEFAQTHNHSPRIQGNDILLMDDITSFDPAGGPSGRGYMRAVQNVREDAWFFTSHLKNDPYMPTSLLVEGAMQLGSFYLAALGFTIKHDAWRFEPTVGNTFSLCCRGQCVPTSKQVVYELFINDVQLQPFPTVYMDILITVDGLKIFHLQHFAVTLTHEFLLTHHPELWRDESDRDVVEDEDGFRLDFNAFMAFAWGPYRDAFGRMMENVADTRLLTRLPGPPYDFLSRCIKANYPAGSMKPGTVVVTEYDFPVEAWYFKESDNGLMPFAVLMEVALQACGWLSMYVGCPMSSDDDLFFRNLDGTGTVLGEVSPAVKTLTTQAELTTVSKLGQIIIINFNAVTKAGKDAVFEMETSFGYFPEKSFVDQEGLPKDEATVELFQRPSDFNVDLTDRPAKYFAGELHMAGPMLMMLDRVTGMWLGSGKHEICQLRAEKTVDPAEWFFKAHFYLDPVQPGSLGCQALTQLLQFFMLETDMHKGIENPRFEIVGTGLPVSWKYRGQVTPYDSLISTTMEIVEVGQDDKGVFAIATGSLWVDDKRIYQLDNLGMRIVSAKP